MKMFKIACMLIIAFSASTVHAQDVTKVLSQEFLLANADTVDYGRYGMAYAATGWTQFGSLYGVDIRTSKSRARLMLGFQEADVDFSFSQVLKNINQWGLGGNMRVRSWDTFEQDHFMVQAGPTIFLEHHSKDKRLAVLTDLSLNVARMKNSKPLGGILYESFGTEYAFSPMIGLRAEYSLLEKATRNPTPFLEYVEASFGEWENSYQATLEYVFYIRPFAAIEYDRFWGAMFRFGVSASFSYESVSLKYRPTE